MGPRHFETALGRVQVGLGWDRLQQQHLKLDAQAVKSALVWALG